MYIFAFGNVSFDIGIVSMVVVIGVSSHSWNDLLIKIPVHSDEKDFH